jgi:hypothetical protein
VLTENSETKGCPDPRLCPPKYRRGDLAQHRNFYNPEFDAKLTDYTHWMRGLDGLSLVAPDEFKFRFAWWGFYDGLYDYLNPRWNDHRNALRARFAQSEHPSKLYQTPDGKFIQRGNSFFFSDQTKEARGIYAHRNRINELYVDYTKGPVFFRVGRQAISWGEADTIALLDVSNPFDLTQGAPGFFEDVDEARIPLWTFRTTVKLADSLGPLSSLFGDVYLVPGPIDTTVPINPIVGGVSPFGPDVPDPQTNIDAANNDPTVTGALGATLRSTTVDHLPENKWSNTRWGARLTGVLLRDYTISGWFFRTFNQAPSPLLTSPGPFDLKAGGLPPTSINRHGARCAPGDVGCQKSFPVVSILERRLESVVGLSATWFSQPVNGIIRTEAEYFNGEPAFIPELQLNARGQLPALAGPDPITGQKQVFNKLQKADYLRFLLGYDRFFFFRPLNPSNSFILSTGFNGTINLSERRGRDYRNPNQKPGHLAAEVQPIPGNPLCPNDIKTKPLFQQQLCIVTPPQNFEDSYKFEGFLQTAIQTDYMHGRLSPRLVLITDVSGIFGFISTATYRFTDNVLASVTYLAIEGTRKAGLATFRAHDMVQARLTYQLN